MAIDKKRTRAIAFDYGNTLIEFSMTQIQQCYDALADALRADFGSVDHDLLAEIRTENRLQVYAGDPPEYRENNIFEITEDLLERLYDTPPTRPQINRILRTRFEAFIESVQRPDYLMELLDDLSGHYTLAVLSNYPDGHAIRESMKKIGIEKYFSTVVVSGDVGFVKPHELPFRVLREELFHPAEDIVFVGDNWLADVQGAKRAGMPVIQTKQWDPPEPFKPQPGDRQPDEVIHHLTELLEIL